jgi:phytoene desaturase
MSNKAVVIGAGFSGLAQAAFLAKDGWDVTVVDMHNQPGGRARLYEQGGFRFDMGPSWYLMPDAFERFFAFFDKKPQDYLELKRLNPQYRLLFDDDSIDIPSDPKEVAKIFDEFEENGAEKFMKYLNSSEEQYNIAVGDFLYREYASISDFIDPKFMQAGRKLQLFGSIDRYISKFFSSKKAKQVLEYTMVFLGGSPSNTPALYNIMSHADFNLGVWYPTGGMNAVAVAIETLCKELGVTFAYNQEVSEILIEDKTVVGVQAKKRFVADLVVCSTDYHHADTQLLAKKYRQYSDRYWNKRTVAPSGLCMYLGVDKKIRGLKHHTLFLQNDWQQHFEQVFDDPKWPDAPSYYICAPSKTEAAVAPKGCENLFVLVPVAADLDDSDENREAFADKILAHLESVLDEDIRNHLLVKKIFSHRDFSSEYHSFKGTALGLSHTLMQSAIFRPRHKAKGVKNLWFTGQFTHPGIGVPMCLVSSEIVARRIRDEKN